MGSRTKGVESFKVNVEVLTPVHVGGGGEAVVGLDALVIGEKVYIVDVECSLKIARAAGLSLNTSQTSLSHVVEFIARNFGKLLNAYKQERIPCKPYRLAAYIADNVRAGETIALPVLGYIPASTIKGLLRTALLYFLLSRAGDHVISAAQQAVKRIVPGDARSLKSAGTIIEQMLLQGLKPHGARSFFQFDAARLLSLSEPIWYEATLELRRFTRVYVDTYGVVASKLVIAFASGSRFTYQAEILESPAKGFDVHKLNLPWLKDLLRVDSVVSLENLRQGLEIMSEIIVDYELSRIKARELSEYSRTLKQFRSGREGSGCYLVRLGYGAGYASKTLLLWFANRAPTIVDEVKRRLAQHYGRLWDDRTVTITSQGVGVGWIRLCLER